MIFKKVLYKIIILEYVIIRLEVIIYSLCDLKFYILVIIFFF